MGLDGLLKVLPSSSQLAEQSKRAYTDCILTILCIFSKGRLSSLFAELIANPRNARVRSDLAPVLTWGSSIEILELREGPLLLLYVVSTSPFPDSQKKIVYTNRTAYSGWIGIEKRHSSMADGQAKSLAMMLPISALSMRVLN